MELLARWMLLHKGENGFKVKHYREGLARQWCPPYRGVFCGLALKFYLLENLRSASLTQTAVIVFTDMIMSKEVGVRNGITN